MLFSSQIQKTVICHYCHWYMNRKYIKIGEDFGIIPLNLDLIL